MIIRSMNNEKEFPEGKTVMECLKALDAFPRGTLAAQSGGVVCELNDELRQDCTLVPLTLENEEGRRIHISLDFLDSGAYQAEIYTDSDDAHYRENPFDINIQQKHVGRGEALDLYMAPGGGFAIRLKKL